MNIYENRTCGAVIYTRVSTGEQDKHGTSSETQLAACRQKAAVIGLPIVAEYYDGGISGGFLLMRTEFQAAIADIQTGRADTLICPNISRYSRDMEHQQAVKKAVRAAGGRLVFCDMDFDDTPEGDLAFGTMGGFAQYEKSVIKDRTMRGKRKRAEEGQQPQRSRSPYGYHIVTNAEIECGLYPAEMRGRYVIVEETAAIVRRIFQDYCYGSATLPKITRAFNSEGIPTPGSGRLWQHATISFILANPVYKGEPVSGRQKCHTDEMRLGQKHKWTGRQITTPEVRCRVPEEQWLKLSSPPLVDAETWELAQQRLVQNRTFLKGNPRQIRMLSGRTVCPYCGAQGVIKQQKANGKQYPYFICGAQRKASQLTGAKPCKGDLYPVALMEDSMVKVMQEAWQNPKALAAVEVAYDVNTTELAQDATLLRKELVRLDKVLGELKAEEMMTGRAQLAGMAAGASADLYSEMFTDIALRRKDSENRRGQISMALASGKEGRKKASQQNTSKAIQQALEEAWKVLSSPDVPGVTKRDILLPLVEKVVLHKDGVEVVFIPGLFDEAGDNNPRSNCYTTCIGIKTHK